MNNYTLTFNTKVVDDVVLYQIQALRDFANIKAGNLGGYVQSEINLDQRGECWVSGNACVSGSARAFDQMSIAFGSCTVDLTNIRDSIRCQTGLAVVNDVVLCYKRVRKDLSSLYDENFKYVVGEVAEVADPEISNVSCASGLHFSHATYWDMQIDLNNTVLLLCEVHIDDVITCQEGKIRAKKCKVLGAC